MDGKQVIKEPKNENSKRLVELDDYTRELMTELFMIRSRNNRFSMGDFMFGGDYDRTSPMAFNRIRTIK